MTTTTGPHRHPDKGPRLTASIGIALEGAGCFIALHKQQHAEQEQHQRQQQQQQQPQPTQQSATTSAPAAAPATSDYDGGGGGSTTDDTMRRTGHDTTTKTTTSGCRRATSSCCVSTARTRQPGSRQPHKPKSTRCHHDEDGRRRGSDTNDSDATPLPALHHHGRHCHERRVDVGVHQAGTYMDIER